MDATIDAMFRVLRAATALSLAVSVLISPLAFDQCAAACALHKQTASANDPVCQPLSPATEHVAQVPVTCGHDHSGTLTISVPSSQSERPLVMLVGFAQSGTHTGPTVIVNRGKPLHGPLPDVASFHLSVSLRI